jgi:membrane protease YdiL (CAAX protease family)
MRAMGGKGIAVALWVGRITFPTFVAMLHTLRDFSTRSPLHGLFTLLFLMFGGASLSSFIGFVLSEFLLGLPLLTQPELADTMTTDPALLPAVRLMQMLQSIGMLIMPALLLLYLRHEFMGGSSVLRTPERQAMLLSIALFPTLLPFINFVADINANLELPGAFGTWATEKEAALALLTERFLDMPHLGWLLLNLFMIGLLPALGEELFFRGVVQRLLGQWSGSMHLSVWLTAILFSAIHMQFLGFVPRVLMGALLGYLFAWSGNLWYPIIAHMVNNGAAVILAYMKQHALSNMGDLETIGIGSPTQVAFSLAFALTLLYLFHAWMQRGQRV